MEMKQLKANKPSKHAKKMRLQTTLLSLCLVAVMVASLMYVQGEKAEAGNLVPPTFITVLEKEDSICTATWYRNKSVAGYQIQYSKDSRFESSTYVTIEGNKNTKKSFDLPCNDRYYLRMRSYNVVKGVTKYSAWGAVVSTIPFTGTWQFGEKSAINTDCAVLYYTKAKNKKNVTVCVNAGHGTMGGTSVKTDCHPDGSPKVTGGTTAEGETQAYAVSSGCTMLDKTPEPTVTLALAKTLKTKLLAEGYNVLMIRESQFAQLDNIARTVMANNNATCHIALHYDSTATDKGAFFCSVPNFKSLRTMYPVSDNWQRHHALGNKLIAGLKTTNTKIFRNGYMPVDLTQTAYSTIPSVDLEVGDRRSSHTAWKLGKIADGIVAGLNLYYTR